MWTFVEILMAYLRKDFKSSRKNNFTANFKIAAVLTCFWFACFMCLPGVPGDALGFIARKLHIPTDFNIYSGNDSRVFIYPQSKFSYVINNPDTCSSKKVFLLIAVKTLPSHIEQRNAIRKTWGTSVSKLYSTGMVKVLFIMGLEPNFNNAHLHDENAVHHDIVQMDFVDSFHNLTVKLITQYQWSVQFCHGARYVMTTDDDVFVNIENLLQYLRCQRPKQLFVGCIHSGAAPIRDPKSKYYVTHSVYPGLYYPDYCTGSGYVLSFDALRSLYRQALYVPMLYIDDVHSGILANAIGLAPLHNEWFLCENRVSLNAHSLRNFITSHAHNPSNMVEMFHVTQKFTRRQLQCVVV